MCRSALSDDRQVLYFYLVLVFVIKVTVGREALLAVQYCYIVLLLKIKMNNKDVVEEDKVQDEGRATEASKEPKVDDEELDALLDGNLNCYNIAFRGFYNGDFITIGLFLDALGGFDNPKVGVAQKQEATDETKVNDTVWSEEFMQQASAEFERNIRLMMGESGSDIGDFSESLLKVSQEAAAKVFENQADSFGASFADTLKYLAEGTESLQVNIPNIMSSSKN